MNDDLRRREQPYISAKSLKNIHFVSIMPRRGCKRRSAIVDDDNDDSDVENTSPRSAATSSNRRSSNKGRASSKPSLLDNEEEITNSDDVMAQEEVEEEQQMMFCSQAPEMTQDILEVKESERSNLMKLSENQRNKLLTDLTRLVLFKGLKNESIASLPRHSTKSAFD
jgi:hypothetical protein